MREIQLKKYGNSVENEITAGDGEQENQYRKNGI